MTINTLADITRYHRGERPDDVAMVFATDERQWTYRELDLEASQCANALRAMGVGVQDRIAYLDKNMPEYYTCVHGAAKLNAVVVAVNWRLAPPEMEYILKHSESKVLLVGGEFLGHVAQIDTDSLEVVVLGDPGDSGYPTYEQWIAGQPSDDPNVPVEPGDTCCQLYTSGTTGLPKGVETTHDNLVLMLRNGLEPLKVTSESVSLACMPVFHITGSGWGILGQYSGAKTIVMRDVDLAEIQRCIPSYRVTHSVFVPVVLQFLVGLPNAAEIDYSSLEMVLYGASPISEQVLVKAMDLFGVGFFQAYGLTETSGGVTLLSPEDHDPGGPKAHLLRSCGRAVAGHELKIVDGDTGESLADGEVGEILMRGPGIMKGYWRNEKATAESIDAQGWFKSGDAGYLQDGYLYIHDRVKDMIISGGENVYPAEIENVLMKHPGIADAAVIGVPSEKWGETVKGIITRADAELSEEAIIAYCRENLAGYKCPTSIAWMDQIPRNPSGKILKKDLRKPYWEGRDRNVS